MRFRLVHPGRVLEVCFADDAVIWRKKPDDRFAHLLAIHASFDLASAARKRDGGGQVRATPSRDPPDQAVLRANCQVTGSSREAIGYR
jgi:hypothetical protein